MKKLLRIAGGAMMLLFGIGVAAVLVSAPKLITGAEGTPLRNAALVLLLLIAYGALFWLGFKLYQRGKGREAPKAKPTPVKPLEPIRPQLTTAASHVADGLVFLCCDEDSRRDPNATLERLVLSIRQGVPRVEVVAGNDGHHGGEPCMMREMPEALRAELTPDSLLGWMREAFSTAILSSVDWSDPVVRARMENWCRRVREQEALNLPEGLYLTEPPFAAELEGVGPDGMEDRSGVRRWLRFKDGADVEAALRSLGDWQKANAEGGETRPIFVLTEEKKLLKDMPDELRDLCKAQNVRVATVEGKHLRDLVGGTSYSLQYREWPGQADDAATYGEWWLGGLRPKDIPTVDDQRSALRTVFERYEFQRPDPGPASPDAYDGGASYRETFCRTIDGENVAVKLPLFELGCFTAAGYDGSSDGVYVDAITGVPCYIVTCQNGGVADFTLYGGKDIGYDLVRDLAKAARLAAFVDIDAQNWEGKLGNPARVKLRVLRERAATQPAPAVRKSGFAANELRAEFARLPGSAALLAHLTFYDDCAESDFYPNGIPRLERKKDGWKFIGRPRGPREVEDGLMRAQMIQALAQAVGSELCAPRGWRKYHRDWLEPKRERVEFYGKAITRRDGHFWLRDGASADGRAITLAEARKIEMDFYKYQASMDIAKAGEEPEAAFAGRGLVRDGSGQWTRESYAVDELVPRLEAELELYHRPREKVLTAFWGGKDEHSALEVFMDRGAESVGLTFVEETCNDHSNGHDPVTGMKTFFRNHAADAVDRKMLYKWISAALKEEGLWYYKFDEGQIQLEEKGK